MMSRTHVVILFLLMPLQWALGQTIALEVDGQAPVQQGPIAGDSLEYGGVVTSQVFSSLGHYFHGKFTEGWNTYGDAATYVLLVKEYFSPRFGTEIRVIYNDKVVYRSVLPRSLVAVSDISRNAAETVHNNVIELGLQTLLFNDPDVAKSGY